MLIYSIQISGLLLASLCQVPSCSIIISRNHSALYLLHTDLREGRFSECKSMTQMTSLITYVTEVSLTKYREIKKQTSNSIKIEGGFCFCYCCCLFVFCSSQGIKSPTPISTYSSELKGLHSY